MIADLKPYPAYKDTGVPWLGEVPSHWRQLPGRAAYREKNVPNTGMKEATVLSLSFGQIVVKSADKQHGLVPASFETYQIIDPGDIVIRPTDLQNDWNSLRFGLNRNRGIITSAYMCFQTKDAMVPEFGHLLLHALDLKKVFYGLGSGLRQNLDWKDFKYLPCLAPPLPEQAAIVRFLDYADRRIRRYIRAKKKLIALLNEQKQAIIHRAVTRGLDPNVRLKPSGVEWLGDVPVHWEVKRLKSLVSSVTSGSRGWSNYGADSGVLFIRIGNLTRSSIDLDMEDVVRLQLPARVLGEAARTRVQANDILLSITAFIGSVAVVPFGIEEAYVSQHVACCRPHAGCVNPRWAAYVLLSPVGLTHGKLSMYGGTKQGLNLDDVGNYVVLLPPLDEQERLVGWIESSSSGVDAGIRSTEREIALLQEYRTRLIADVVTGKIDVREAAARLPDETEEMATGDDSDLPATEDEGEEGVNGGSEENEIESLPQG